MTEILINKKPFSRELKEDITIDEVMDLLLDDKGSNNDVITGIEIDGKLLSPEEEDKAINQKVNQFSHINFTAKSSIELAYEALDSCTNYIDVVIAKIQTLTGLYQENKLEEANSLFAEVIEIMDLFVQLMSKIHRTLKVSSKLKNRAKVIQDLEIHLLSVLKALIPAKEKNDIIMLCDLLEYELVDNLTQWKIKAIPELRKSQDV